jgi:hypothetical protein
MGGRRQKTEFGSVNAECGRGKRAEGSKLKAESRGQRIEDRRQN